MGCAASTAGRHGNGHGAPVDGRLAGDYSGPKRGDVTPASRGVTPARGGVTPASGGGTAAV